jgi:hypothetical protein
MFFFRYLFLFFIIFYSQNVSANQKIMLGGKDFFISDDGTYELIKKTGSLIDIFNVEYLYFVKKNNGKVDHIVEVKVGAHLKMREYKYINYDTNCNLKNQIYLKKRIGDSFNCWFIGAYDYFKDQDNFEETYSNPHSPPTFMFNGGIRYFLKKNKSENIKFIKSSHNFFAITHGGRHYIVNYLINYKNLMSTNDYNILRLGIANRALKEKLIKYFEYNQSQFENSLNIKNDKKFSLINKKFKTKNNIKNSDSISNELLKLKNLLDQGVITKEEFKKAKSKILN